MALLLLLQYTNLLSCEVRKTHSPSPVSTWAWPYNAFKKLGIKASIPSAHWTVGWREAGGAPPAPWPWAHRRHIRQCPRQGAGTGRCPGWRTGASSAGSPCCTGLCPRWAHRGAGAPSSVGGPAALPSRSRCSWCLSAVSGRCSPCPQWWSWSTTRRWRSAPSWEGEWVGQGCQSFTFRKLSPFQHVKHVILITEDFGTFPHRPTGQ